MKNKKFWTSLLAGLMAVIMLLSLLLSILPHKASAKTSSEIKDQIGQIEEENKELEEQLEDLKGKLNDLKAEQKENKKEIKALIAEKNLIDQQVGILYGQLTNMNEQIAAYNVLIADKQEELDEATKNLEKLNNQYKERIRAMEEDGELSYWSVLFEAHSFSDLLDRLNMVQEIAAADNRRLEQLRQAAADVEAIYNQLQTEKAELAESKKKLDAAQADFIQKGLEAQELLNELTAKMDELAQQADDYKNTMGSIEDAMEDFEEQLGKLESDLDEALYKEYLATMTTAPTKPPSSGSGSSGGKVNIDTSGITWVIPCNYRYISSAYGWRIHPVYGYKKFHHGVDMATSCKMKKDGTTDSPVWATRSGVVTVSGWSDSAGWYVKIDHLDGFSSAYMHLCCRPFVKVGDVVAAGQVVGCIGSTGVSTGDHLHFSLYFNGESVNPMEYLG
jgi:murein DD-endopeptidase MepM/ murein hydrolase activator NlpD